MRYDRQGDQHYDVTSAFIKSIRGSDADAALHYLARMIEAGEDPRFIARRLVILASEDIGLADPTALPTAVAAAQAVQLIGMPEARLNLAQATIALAVAPKSNAVTTRHRRRQRRRPRGEDRAGAAAPARRPLRRVEEDRARQGYRYSHDEPFGIAEQQYAPDVVADAALLPADVARRRGRGQGALGAGPARSSAGSDATVSDSRTRMDVHVQVLGVLVAADVRQHCCCPTLLLDVSRNVLDDLQERTDVVLVRSRGARQRCDVSLGHDDEMHLPERPRVMEGEHSIVFVYDVELSHVGDGDVAVEVVTVVLRAHLHCHLRVGTVPSA